MQVAVNGIRMNYVQAGQGPAILLIHGFPLDSGLWEPQLAALSSQARVIAPDLRGAGQSEAPEGVYTMETHAGDLVALLDELQVGQAVVCGLSMGGYVALALWRRYPTRVRALALVDTRAGADSPAGRQSRLDMVEKVRQAGSAGSQVAVDAMLSRLLCEATLQERPELVETVRNMILRQPPAGIIGAQLGMAERLDATPVLASISVPTITIFGAQDVITPPETEGALLASIVGSRQAIIPSAGHLSNLEQPEAFNSALRGWYLGL